MLEVLVVLAAAGFGGGWLAGYASLWEDIRGRLNGWKYVAYERFSAPLGPWRPIPTGTRPTQARHVITAGLWPWLGTWGALAVGKACEAATCPVCAGWHAAWITAVTWTALGDFPLDMGAGIAVWVAAGGVQTLVMHWFQRTQETHEAALAAGKVRRAA